MVRIERGRATLPTRIVQKALGRKKRGFLGRMSPLHVAFDAALGGYRRCQRVRMFTLTRCVGEPR